MLFKLEVFWVSLTLLVFFGGTLIYNRYKKPFFNPVLLSVVSLILFIKLTKADIEDFNQNTRVINFFLGPAVVALGYLLHKQWAEIAKNLLAILLSIATASLVGIISVVSVAYLMGADAILIATLAPKSVTTPIAIGIANKTGGIASLTAAIVIAVGVFGAVVGSWFLNLIKVENAFARGLAFGTAAHGIGTARAIDEGEINGTAAALAIGLTGVFTVLQLFIINFLFGNWSEIQHFLDRFFILAH